MTHKLVIAEKPSVARSIAGVIGATEKHDGYLQGNGYLVSWCIGHLVSFADAGRYDERFKKWRYKSLCFTGIKDRHGVYAMINRDERRDVSIRRPRPSIRKQLSDTKQAASPKKAAARTRKNELEV